MMGFGKPTEKSVEFNQKQMKKQSELIHGSQPKTQREKDIWNLKYARYSIKYGSYFYRRGMISSLDRAIKKLEETND